MRAGDRKQWNRDVPTVKQARQFLHFHEAELRGGEYDEIGFADVRGIGFLECADIRFTDRVRRQGWTRRDHIGEVHRLGRYAGDVKQRH